jgi:hypothetical protein
MPAYDEFHPHLVGDAVDTSTIEPERGTEPPKPSFEDDAAEVVRIGPTIASFNRLGLAIRDPRLNRAHLLVLQKLMSMLSSETGACFPGRDMAAEAVGLEFDRAQNCFYDLRRRGYLRWEKRAQNGRQLFHYTLPLLSRPVAEIEAAIAEATREKASRKKHTASRVHDRPCSNSTTGRATTTRPAVDKSARPAVCSNLNQELEKKEPERRESAHMRAPVPEVTPDPVHDLEEVQAEAVASPPPRSAPRQRPKKARAAHAQPAQADLLGDPLPKRSTGKYPIPPDALLPDDWRAEAVNDGMDPTAADELWGTLKRWNNGGNKEGKIHTRNDLGWKSHWGNFWRRELKGGARSAPRTSNAGGGGWLGAAFNVMGGNAHA